MIFLNEHEEQSAHQMQREINRLQEQLKEFFVKDHASRLAHDLYKKYNLDRISYYEAIEEQMEFMRTNYYAYYAAYSDDDLEDLATDMIEKALRDYEDKVYEQ